MQKLIGGCKPQTVASWPMPASSDRWWQKGNVGLDRHSAPGLLGAALRCASMHVTAVHAHLSFTEQHGSMISSLAATLPTEPSVTRLRNTMGVLPERASISVGRRFGTGTPGREAEDVRERLLTYELRHIFRNIQCRRFCCCRLALDT